MCCFLYKLTAPHSEPRNVILRCCHVLDQYFKRASEATKSKFIQERGFNLLAAQLKQYKVSVQLISALVSLALGQEVNLSHKQSVTLSIFCLYVPRSIVQQ